MDKETLQSLALRHGTQSIGATQADVAYSAVASGGTGLIKFVVAAGHPFKKGMDIYVASGIYAGIHRVKKVDTLGVYVPFEFTVTAAGNLERKAALDGYGFIVDEATSLVIADILPDDPTIDVQGIKSHVYQDLTEVFIPFRKLRVTGADVTVIRKPPQAVLDYDRASAERNQKPALQTAVVTDAADTAIVLTYGGSLLDATRVPTISKFVLSGIASTPTITSITVVQATGKVTLNLSAAVVVTDIPRVVYTKSTMEKSNSTQDIWGHLADSFNVLVTNQVV